MKVEKKVVAKLTKCYSLAAIRRDGRRQYLVASEKEYPCIELDEDGNQTGKVWDGPGGVMTLEPVPDGGGAFLATHRFYSPNNSAQASIVLATPGERSWEVRTLCQLPFVHRFGILERDGRRYIAAATLKSAHAFKDDWTCPGRVWVGELPDLLGPAAEGAALQLTPLISGLYRNHGFFKYREDGHDVALVGTDGGVYKLIPPAVGGEWRYERLLDVPASDMAVVDLDGDGVEELVLLSPFHGDRLSVYKLGGSGAVCQKEFSRSLPFLHALAVGNFQGKQVAVIGHRGGERELLLLQWERDDYVLEVLDRGVGPANVLCVAEGAQLRILSANREIDEVALYTVRP